MVLNTAPFISVKDAKRNFQKVIDIVEKYEEALIVEGGDDDDNPVYVMLSYDDFLELQETAEWKSAEKKAFEAFVG